MATNATVSILSDLANTREFVADVKALTLSEAVESYLIAHTTEEVGKNRREAIRDVLMAEAKAHGTSNEKGGQRLFTQEGHTIIRERRVSSAPDEKKLLSLLDRVGLNVEDAFDKVTVLQPNPNKVALLVENGHITEEDAQTLYKESFACFVSPNGPVEALLENALPVGAVEKKRTRR
jgi:hypothetical protein